MEQQFFAELVLGLVDPWVIVAPGREMVFATVAFRRLVGDGGLERSCNQLFCVHFEGKPAASCCWDGLDTYLEVRRSPLWLIRTTQDGLLSVLCDLHPVDVAGSHKGIAIRVRPLAEGCSRVGLGFFRSIQRTLSHPEGLRQWLGAYMCQTYHLRVAWLDMATGEPEDPGGDGLVEAASAEVLVRAITESGARSPFDVVVRERGSLRVVRVFPPPHKPGSRILVAEEQGPPLNEQALNEIQSAVIVGNEAAPDVCQEEREGTILSVLTRRQQRIVSLVAEGLCDIEIANRLNLSPHTVKNHLRACMTRLGVHKRTQLVALYSARG